MSYEFPPDVSQRVTTLLERGYDTVDDVLRHALSALEREQQEIAAIQEGINDMESGRYRTLEEVDAEIRKRHSFAPDS
jgi:predicted transcriptional regulator